MNRTFKVIVDMMKLLNIFKKFFFIKEKFLKSL